MKLPIRYRLRPPELDDWGGANLQDGHSASTICCKSTHEEAERNFYLGII